MENPNFVLGRVTFDSDGRISPQCKTVMLFLSFFLLLECSKITFFSVASLIFETLDTFQCCVANMPETSEAESVVKTVFCQQVC